LENDWLLFFLIEEKKAQEQCSTDLSANERLDELFFPSKLRPTCA
jgi:hypothetical protein